MTDLTQEGDEALPVQAPTLFEGHRQRMREIVARAMRHRVAQNTLYVELHTGPPAQALTSMPGPIYARANTPTWTNAPTWTAIGDIADGEITYRHEVPLNREIREGIQAGQVILDEAVTLLPGAVPNLPLREEVMEMVNKRVKCACGEPDDPNWEHAQDECTFLDRPSSDWEDEGPA